jgi:hypothetical protein
VQGRRGRTAQNIYSATAIDGDPRVLLSLYYQHGSRRRGLPYAIERDVYGSYQPANPDLTQLHYSHSASHVFNDTFYPGIGESSSSFLFKKLMLSKSPENSKNRFYLVHPAR